VYGTVNFIRKVADILLLAGRVSEFLVKPKRHWPFSRQRILDFDLKL
jgi:hypothetical protein